MYCKLAWFLILLLISPLVFGQQDFEYTPEGTTAERAAFYGAVCPPDTESYSPVWINTDTPASPVSQGCIDGTWYDLGGAATPTTEHGVELWDATIPFGRPEVVERAGSIYRANTTTTGVDPRSDDGTNWTQIAPGETPPTVALNTIYPSVTPPAEPPFTFFQAQAAGNAVADEIPGMNLYWHSVSTGGPQGAGRQIAHRLPIEAERMDIDFVYRERSASIGNVSVGVQWLNAGAFAARAFEGLNTNTNTLTATLTSNAQIEQRGTPVDIGGGWFQQSFIVHRDKVITDSALFYVQTTNTPTNALDIEYGFRVRADRTVIPRLTFPGDEGKILVARAATETAWEDAAAPVDENGLPDYDAAKTDYTEFATVRDPATGFVYRSLQNQVAANPLTDVANWEQTAPTPLPAPAPEPTPAEIVAGASTPAGEARTWSVESVKAVHDEFTDPLATPAELATGTEAARRALSPQLLGDLMLAEDTPLMVHHFVTDNTARDALPVCAGTLVENRAACIQRGDIVYVNNSDGGFKPGRAYFRVHTVTPGVTFRPLGNDINWRTTTNYALNNLVERNGVFYRALQPNTGSNPAIQPSLDWAIAGYVQADWTATAGTQAEILNLPRLMTATDQLETNAANQSSDEVRITPQLLFDWDQSHRPDKCLPLTSANDGLLIEKGCYRVFCDAPYSLTLRPPAHAQRYEFDVSGDCANNPVLLVRSGPNITVEDANGVDQNTDFEINRTQDFTMQYRDDGNGLPYIVRTAADVQDIVNTIKPNGGYDAATNTPDLTLPAQETDGVFFFQYFVTDAGPQTLTGLGLVNLEVDDSVTWFGNRWRLQRAADQVQTTGQVDGNGTIATPIKLLDGAANSAEVIAWVDTGYVRLPALRPPVEVVIDQAVNCGDWLRVDAATGARTITGPAGPIPDPCWFRVEDYRFQAANANITVDLNGETIPLGLPVVNYTSVSATANGVTLDLRYEGGRYYLSHFGGDL